jgi:hypothetical protein
MMRRIVGLCCIAVLLGGCQMFSGTRMEEVSIRQAAPAVLNRVLLVGITTTPQAQADMEQAFAREFTQRKREVLLAGRLFPGDRQPLRDEVMQRLKSDGVTGVLVVRLLSYERGVEGAPAPGFSLRAPARDPGTRVGWEQDPWLATAPAGGAELAAKAIVETRLYDVASGEVVWQARSRTLVRSDSRKELDGFVSAIISELRKGGWI